MGNFLTLKGPINPLFTSNFRATTIPKTFLLNAFVISIIATVAIEIKSGLNKIGEDNKKFREVEKGAILFFSTFFAGLLCYWMMYVLLNYGGGMMTNQSKLAF